MKIKFSPIPSASKETQVPETAPSAVLSCSQIACDEEREGKY